MVKLTKENVMDYINWLNSLAGNRGWTYSIINDGKPVVLFQPYDITSKNEVLIVLNINYRKFQIYEREFNGRMLLNYPSLRSIREIDKYILEFIGYSYSELKGNDILIRQIDSGVTGFADLVLDKKYGGYLKFDEGNAYLTQI